MHSNIQIEHLCFSYGEEQPALDNISLTINQGEQMALIGQNGSGKTSLVKHLNGLLQPENGSVSIGEKNTKDYPVAELARHVALLFQNPDDQICKRRVEDEVGLGPKTLGFSEPRTKVLVEKALSLFNLHSMKNQNPYDLGYSERKRVAIASIIAMDTPVVVLDEPTAGLDSREMRLLIHSLEMLQRDGKTVIVISHDMDFVAEQFPRIVCLHDGKKIFDGPTQNAFQNEEMLQFCNLLPPQIVRLSTFFHYSQLTLTPQQFVDAFFRQQRKKQIIPKN